VLVPEHFLRVYRRHCPRLLRLGCPARRFLGAHLSSRCHLRLPQECCHRGAKQWVRYTGKFCAGLHDTNPYLFVNWGLSFLERNSPGHADAPMQKPCSQGQYQYVRRYGSAILEGQTNNSRHDRTHDRDGDPVGGLVHRRGLVHSIVATWA
jgi:hypothetical protein